MSECEHKQLILTSQRGTDGFPVYRCALRCGALFKVKPEEITAEFAATTTNTQGVVDNAAYARLATKLVGWGARLSRLERAAKAVCDCGGIKTTDEESAKTLVALREELAATVAVITPPEAQEVLANPKATPAEIEAAHAKTYMIPCEHGPVAPPSEEVLAENREVRALREAKEALDQLWAAIGDALCSGKGIDKAYSQSVASQVDSARRRAEAALAATPTQPDVEQISEVARSIAKDYLDSRVIYSSEPLVNLIVNRIYRLIRHSAATPTLRVQPDTTVKGFAGDPRDSK